MSSFAAQQKLIDDLTTRVTAAEAAAQAAQDTADAITRSADTSWLVMSGAMVFFMQAGFGMLEAGAVSRKNVVNILFKNVLDGAVAAIGFWLIGYGIAFGETAGGFIGTTNFGAVEIFNAGSHLSEGVDGWQFWFFQWTFAGTAATIVSGSVAERTKLEAYIIFSIVLTAFVYPVVVHWVWASGFLSAWGAIPDADGNARPIFAGNDTSNGVIDFAGSGVCHMVGGWCGLIGALTVGPRLDRFDREGKANSMPYYNTTLMALGTFILWFGWYGFNCGSTLAVSGNLANLAGKVAMTTTIAGATSCLTCVILTRILEGHFDVGMGLNGILAGLVSITAGCSVVDPWMAFIIGLVGGHIYYFAHYLLLRLRIDDPLDAFPIHGLCGMWAMFAVGIFCTDANVQYAGYPNVNDACARGEQFGVQVVGVIIIIAWSVACASALFLGMKYTMGIRVSEVIEKQGLDISEHGGTVEQPTDEELHAMAMEKTHRRGSWNNNSPVTQVVTVGNGATNGAVPFNAVAPGDGSGGQAQATPGQTSGARPAPSQPKEGWGEVKQKEDSLDLQELLS